MNKWQLLHFSFSEWKPPEQNIPEPDFQKIIETLNLTFIFKKGGLETWKFIKI